MTTYAGRERNTLRVESWSVGTAPAPMPIPRLVFNHRCKNNRPFGVINLANPLTQRDTSYRWLHDKDHAAPAALPRDRASHATAITLDRDSRRALYRVIFPRHPALVGEEKGGRFKSRDQL